MIGRDKNKNNARYLAQKDQFGLNSSALQRLGDYALHEEIEIKVAVDWIETASAAKPARGALNPSSWVGILRK